MKVLFLDIDEVLVTRKTRLLYGSLFRTTMNVKLMLDQPGMKLIELLMNKGVKVVLSSTWRLNRTPEYTSKVLGFEIIDHTCAFPFKGSMRGHEIEIWLKDHPEVTHYCIIDDGVDMLESQFNNFVRVDPSDGISCANIESICSILDIPLLSLRKNEVPPEHEE